MHALLLLAFRSLGSSRLRTTLTIAAIFLGVAAIMGSLTTIGSIRASLNRSAQDAAGYADLEVRALAEQGFPYEAIQQVRDLPGVRVVAPILEKRTFMRAGGEHGFVHLVGLDPVAEEQVHRLELREGRWPLPGEPAVVLMEDWARGRALLPGADVELITRDGFQTFSVVGLALNAGLARESFGRVLLVSLETAQEAFGLGGRVSDLVLILDAPAMRDTVARELAAVLPGGYATLVPDDLGRDLRESADQLAVGLLVFGITALFVGAFLIFNTFSMTVSEQRWQIGLLRAAGVTRGQVLLLVLLQALVMGVLGAVLGVLGGIGIARVLLVFLTAWGAPVFQGELFTPEALVLSAVVGVGASLISALLPAWTASGIAPVEALRHSSRAAVGAPSVFQWLAAAGLSLLGLVMLSWPFGADIAVQVRLMGVFMLLSSAALAAIALVRPLSRLCALPFRWLLGAEARLAELNLRRAERRAGLTVVGFTASLALMVAASALGTSASTAGQERVTRLFPAELLVVSPIPQPYRILDAFAQAAPEARVTPLRSLSVAWGSIWLDAMAVDPDAYATSGALEVVRELPGGAWERMRAGRGVLVPRRLAETRGLDVGHTLELLGPSGPVAFEVAGILSTSFPSADNLGALVLSWSDLPEHLGVESFTLLAVRPVDGVSQAGFQRSLAERAELFGMEVVSVSTIRGAVADGVSQLLAVFTSLIAVGFVVAGLGIVNTMMMNVAERTREIGVLRALGLTREQVQVMVLAEAGIMGLIGGLLGVVSGLGLAYLLLVMARSDDFDPSLVWPLESMLLALVAAVCASMLSAFPPARFAARVRVSRAVVTD